MIDCLSFSKYSTLEPLLLILFIKFYSKFEPLFLLSKLVFIDLCGFSAGKKRPLTERSETTELNQARKKKTGARPPATSRMRRPPAPAPALSPKTVDNLMHAVL